MIIKFKVNGSWRLIDHISEVAVAPVEEGEYYEGVRAVVHYNRDGENVTQPLADEAYLLNDEGKTLQVLLRVTPKY